MTVATRFGLRYLIPALLTPLSAGFFWYGMVEDRIKQAAFEKAGWHFGAAWHPGPLVQLVGSVNLPAMLGGLLLTGLVPESILYVIVFGVFVPVLWWRVGIWADSECALGRSHGQVRPPVRDRAITLSCVTSAFAVLAVRLLAHVSDPRIVGTFWFIMLPVSIFTGAAKWRRKWLPIINRKQ